MIDLQRLRLGQHSIFHIVRSATQRVLQLDPVAAFLGRGVVQDDGAPLVVLQFPGCVEGGEALRGHVTGAAAASRMAGHRQLVGR